MHIKFLEMLACPHSGAPLNISAETKVINDQVDSGWLETPDKENRYPVIKAIPRFVKQETYSESFGYEWKKWARVQYESENVGKPMEGHTQKMFDMITGFSRENMVGKTVVEFGCGGGRFIDICRKRGAIAIGIDLSLAVETTREIFRKDPNVLIVQGDVLMPPFKKEIFDFGYSLGVLHHTPNPEMGFQSLVSTIKKGGKVGCSVYPNFGLYSFPSVRIFRKIHRVIKNSVGIRVANFFSLQYSFFSAKFLYPLFQTLSRKTLLWRLIPLLEKFFFVVVRLPDEKWRILDTFDAITPHFASTHTGKEVIQWFEKSGCRDIVQSPWGETSFFAIKS